METYLISFTLTKIMDEEKIGTNRIIIFKSKIIRFFFFNILKYKIVGFFSIYLQKQKKQIKKILLKIIFVFYQNKLNTFAANKLLLQ